MWNLSKICPLANNTLSHINFLYFHSMVFFLDSQHWIRSFKPHSKILNEIKRSLLLGRKDMRNLDSILKSRDITLLTNVCIVKAIIFPVVIYGFEIWTIKKAEHQRIGPFELCREDSWESLGQLGDQISQS